MATSRPLTTRRALLGMLALAIVAAGCGGSDVAGDAGTEPSPSEVATTAAPTTAPPTAEPTPTASPSEPSTGEAGTPDEADLPAAGSEPTESAGFPSSLAEEIVFLDEISLGDHESYERVVFTFDGPEALPAWHAEYVDEVVASGSGLPVDVEGAAHLNVVLSGATGVDLRGEEPVEVYTGPDRISGSDAGLSTVQEVVEAGDFEATMDWAIGLDEQRAFRVFTLQGPARVVVDVMTD